MSTDPTYPTVPPDTATAPAPDAPAQDVPTPAATAPAPDAPAQDVPTPAPPAPAPDATAQDTAAPAAADTYKDWPVKGGPGDTPQPWDLAAQGLPVPGVSAPPAEPGAPDTTSPVQPREGLPMLSSGSQGDAVRAIGVALGQLGYDNSISRGSIDNAYNVVDDSVVAAVEAFRRDYGVQEDPSQFPRDPRNNAQSHIGPWTQEAILVAVERL